LVLPWEKLFTISVAGFLEIKNLKAVQIGGPSGGCIPANHLNVKVDYESLKELGSIMGSGGLIVMDEDTCMVDIARYFMEFIQEESCGKCTPCREGTRVMLEILTRICEGKGKIGRLGYSGRASLSDKRIAHCVAWDRLLLIPFYLP